VQEKARKEEGRKKKGERKRGQNYFIGTLFLGNSRWLRIEGAYCIYIISGYCRKSPCVTCRICGPKKVEKPIHISELSFLCRDEPPYSKGDTVIKLRDFQAAAFKER
jgi:hypothetical protein